MAIDVRMRITFAAIVTSTLPQVGVVFVLLITHFFDALSQIALAAIAGS